MAHSFSVSALFKLIQNLNFELYQRNQRNRIRNRVRGFVRTFGRLATRRWLQDRDSYPNSYRNSYQKKIISEKERASWHQKAATWHLAKLKQKLLSNCLRSGHHRSFWIRTLNSNSEIKSCTLAFRLIFEWNFRHLLPFFDQFTGGAYPLTLCVHSNTRPTDLQTRRLHLCELSRWNGALLRCQSVPLARCWWTAFDCHLVMAISYSYPLAQGEHRHSVIRFSTRILSLNYLAIFGNFHQTCWPY